MGHVRHDINKRVRVDKAHGHIKDFREIEKERKMEVLTALALATILIYFFYVFNKVAILLTAVGTKGDFQAQFALMLPHIILLSLLGVPIVRKILFWIRFTPFYLPRQAIRKIPSKVYNKIRLKRFVVYFGVSLVCFLIAMFYLFIL